MTLRLEDSLVRGELDCREKGRVTGRLWLLGRSDPVELDLIGIPARDLAGLHVQLKCEYPPEEQAPGLPTTQMGRLLVCTACERKRIPDGAERDIRMRVHKRIPHPWCQRNVVHLEWVDTEGAHIILQGTGIILNVLEPASWCPTPEEEREAATAVATFRRSWQDQHELDGLLLPEVQEESGPISAVEREADLEHRKMERLHDRIQVRLEKLEEFTEAEYEEIYRQERERIRLEFGEPEMDPPTPEQVQEQAKWVEEMNRLAQEAMEDLDELDLYEPMRHPLVAQCDSLQEKVQNDMEEGNWLPEASETEHPMRELNWGLHMATAKLVNAMGLVGSAEWPPPRGVEGPVLVKLKQVRGYLNDVHAALDAADDENLGVSAWRRAIRHEVSELLHDTETLITDLRERLA